MPVIPEELGRGVFIPPVKFLKSHVKWASQLPPTGHKNVIEQFLTE